MSSKQITTAIIGAITAIGKQLMARIFVVLILLLLLVSAYCGFIFYQYAIVVDEGQLEVIVNLASIKKDDLNSVVHTLDEKEKIQQGYEPSIGRDIFR
jgi:hypothetical protein